MTILVDDILNALNQAKKQRVLVQVGRHEIESPEFFVHGFVLDYSQSFVLMQIISERFDFDGYEVVRTLDITSIESDFPQRSFLTRALKLKGLHPRKPKGVDLSDTRSLLKSIEKRYPLLVIQRELVEMEECEVCRIKMAADEFYTIKYISPTAQWEDDDHVYRYSDVTRVCFDGAYENTLALVAGIII